MRLPFLIDEPPKFEPKESLGDENLPAIERRIAKMLSILEQKVDYAAQISIRAYNIAIVVAFLLLLTNGVQLFNILQIILKAILNHG